MKKFSSIQVILVGLVTLVFSVQANAYLIGLEDGSAEERAALVGTLESMGHTVTTTIDGSLDLIISAPGNGTDDYPGIPYLQISDHGEDHLANSWQSLPSAATVVSITLTGNHPILQGLDSSWDSLGFWHYDDSSYVGWVTGVSGLADAEADSNPYTDVLAVSGSDIYIGWNVYGADASNNDLLLLENSIEYLVSGAVAGSTEKVPTLSTPALLILLLMFSLFAVAYLKRARAI